MKRRSTSRERSLGQCDLRTSDRTPTDRSQRRSRERSPPSSRRYSPIHRRSPEYRSRNTPERTSSSHKSVPTGILNPEACEEAIKEALFREYKTKLGALALKMGLDKRDDPPRRHFGDYPDRKTSADRSSRARSRSRSRSLERDRYSRHGQRSPDRELKRSRSPSPSPSYRSHAQPRTQDIKCPPPPRITNERYEVYSPSLDERTERDDMYSSRNIDREHDKPRTEKDYRSRDTRYSPSQASEGDEKYSHNRKWDQKPKEKYGYTLKEDGDRRLRYSPCRDFDRHNYRRDSPSRPHHGSPERGALQTVQAQPPSVKNASSALSLMPNKDKRRLAAKFLNDLLDFSSSDHPGPQGFLEIHSHRINALKSLELPDAAGFILFHLGYRNLPAANQKDLDETISVTEIPTFEKVTSFAQLARDHELNVASTLPSSEPEVPKSGTFTTVNFKTSILPTSQTPAIPPAVTVPPQVVPITASSSPQAVSSTTPQVTSTSESTSTRTPITFPTNTPPHRDSRCRMCLHPSHSQLFVCPRFKALNVATRIYLVNQLGQCTNCLGNHARAYCVSNSSCRICHNGHHTLLHGIDLIESMDKATRLLKSLQ